MIIYPLPAAVPSNVVYESIAIDRLNYDPKSESYSALVWGVSKGETVPLLLQTQLQLRRIEQVVVRKAEIADYMARNPETLGNELAAAFGRCHERLLALSEETEESPYEAR